MIYVKVLQAEKPTTKITFLRNCERVIFYAGKGMFIRVQAGL